MKKILALVMAVAMIACFASVTSAAEFVEVKSFDFSNTDGLKGFTASWTADNKCNVAAAEVADGVIVDGAFVMGTMGFVVDETIDASNGIKVAFDATLDFDKISGSPWFQGILTFLNADGKAADVLALAGTEFEHSMDAFYCNLQGGGKTFQVHTSVLNDETLGNDVVWGGDDVDLVSGQKYAVEFIIVPNEAGGADVTINVDGAPIAIPNNPEFANLLTDELVLMIGATHYGDYPTSVTVDNVVVSTMQEEAAQTGFATVALAIAAIASGAYIVTKKH